MQSIYDAAGGMAGMRRLAGAWHVRVMADAVVSHAFSHGFHPDHTERLAAYWAEALGGPAAYSSRHGDETHVVRMHSGNGPHDEMDRRAIACFDQALDDVGLAPGDAFAAGASRLFRLGDDDHDGPLPRLRGRRPRRPGHPALVLERPGGLSPRVVHAPISTPRRAPVAQRPRCPDIDASPLLPANPTRKPFLGESLL